MYLLSYKHCIKFSSIHRQIKEIKIFFSLEVLRTTVVLVEKLLLSSDVLGIYQQITVYLI